MSRYVAATMAAIMFVIVETLPIVLAQSGDNGIVFISMTEGYRDVFWMDSQGDNVTQLTNDSAQDLYPAWSPDGSQIAFVSDRDGSYAIYAMASDGSAIRRIVGGDGGYYEFPSWSPDGRNLVYSSDKAGTFDLYRIDLRSESEPQRLTTDGNADESDPSWSPDGSQIAYLQTVDGATHIFVVNANGGSPRPMIPAGGSDFAAPRWSPDGRSLAFGMMTYDSVGNVAELYIYDLETGEERLLTSVENSFITGISWSADGEALVYAQRSVRGDAVLYEVGLDGEYATVLTAIDARSEFPSWSTPALGSSASVPNVLGQPPAGCPDLLTSRLVIGELGRVMLGQSVNVRNGPGVNAQRIDNMPSGRLFEVRGGPVCADGYSWWEVYHNQRVGYAAESGNGEYWLEPIGFLSQPRITPDAQATTDTNAQYAYQPFEHGYMFWIRSTNQIFVLVTGENWRVFPDFFVEGEQETDPTYQAPTRLLQPRRGFGKVWRDNLPVRNSIGWGTYREVGYNNRFQYDPTTGTIVLYDPVGRAFTLESNGTWRRG